jgi:hypothetical protein
MQGTSHAMACESEELLSANSKAGLASKTSTTAVTTHIQLHATPLQQYNMAIATWLLHMGWPTHKLEPESESDNGSGCLIMHDPTPTIMTQNKTCSMTHQHDPSGLM